MSAESPPAAFIESWIDTFGDVYRQSPLSGLSWFSGSAGGELQRLVVDGVIPRGSTVVDLGCGPGVDALFLAGQGMRVTGVDISEEALAAARHLAQVYGVHADFVHGSVLEVPLADGHADVVSDSFVFHNVRDEARGPYAREVFRLLRPGGLFVLRGFSDHMTPGTGPRRLTAEDLLLTFMPGFTCEHLSRFRNLPTEKRPDQWHWMSLWRRKDAWGVPSFVD